MTEKEVLRRFNRDYGPNLFSKLGIVYGSSSKTYYNKKNKKYEYDILMLNVRTKIGTQVPVLNIEIEDGKINNGYIRHKSNGNYLLSFIMNEHSNYDKLLDSNKVYSTLLYDKDRFISTPPNIYTEYLISKVKTRRNMSQLENILNNNMNKKLKNGVLFFLNDLFRDSNKVSRWGLRHIFYEPEINCVRGLFGDEHNRMGINFFFDNEKVKRWSREGCMHSILKKYLGNKYSARIASYADKDELIILTTEDNIFLRAAQINDKDVSRLIKVSGTSKEVLPGSSIKRIIEL